MPQGSTLVLGQEYLTGGFGMVASRSLSGHISQFGIWDRVLASNEIQDIHDCKIGETGNVVDHTGDWTRGDVS